MKQIVQILRQFIAVDRARNLEIGPPSLAVLSDIEGRPTVLACLDQHDPPEHVKEKRLAHIDDVRG